MPIGTRFNTYNVTPSNSPYRIVAPMNIITCTFKMSSADGDVATLEGSLELNNSSNASQPSQPVGIGPGQAGILQSPGASQALDGLTFIVEQGTLSLILAQ